MFFVLFLVYLAFELGLDVLLGAFAAGVVIRLFTVGDDSTVIKGKFEAIGYGSLIPIFFIVSGIRFDLHALTSNPGAFLRLPLFLGLFLVVRGLPALLLYRGDMSRRERIPLALFSATGLPLIVVITQLGVAAGRMRPENAAGAGRRGHPLGPAAADAGVQRTAACRSGRTQGRRTDRADVRPGRGCPLRRRRRRYVPARYSWTDRTALDPSPTADATRFMESARTSPTPNTPGADVSKGNGSRPANTGWSRSGRERAVGEDEAVLVELDRVLQPRRRRFRADEAEQRRRSPPLPGGGRRVLDLDSTTRWPSPQSVRTSLSVITSMWGSAVIRSTRYADMVAVRSGRRTTSRTALPAWLRKIAACPAEFPPPTTATSSPPHDRASSSVAA